VAFRFRLFLEDGDEAEPWTFTTAARDWRVGDELVTADRRRWRVLDVVKNDWEGVPLVYHGFLMVEET
jgi:hypothetical protein